MLSDGHAAFQTDADPLFWLSFLREKLRQEGHDDHNSEDTGRRQAAHHRYETEKAALRFAETSKRLIRSVGPADRDLTLALSVFFTRLHPHEPRVAAHLAVLHETAVNVRLDEDLDFLAAVGARYKKVTGHGALLHAKTVDRAPGTDVDAPATQGWCRVDLLAEIVDFHDLPRSSCLQHSDLAFSVGEKDFALSGDG